MASVMGMERQMGFNSSSRAEALDLADLHTTRSVISTSLKIKQDHETPFKACRRDMNAGIQTLISHQRQLQQKRRKTTAASVQRREAVPPGKVIEPFDTMKDLSNVVREEAVSCDEGYKHINAGISLATETVAPHFVVLIHVQIGYPLTAHSSASEIRGLGRLVTSLDALSCSFHIELVIFVTTSTQYVLAQDAGPGRCRACSLILLPRLALDT
jgi:hypothetical protein